MTKDDCSTRPLASDSGSAVTVGPDSRVKDRKEIVSRFAQLMLEDGFLDFIPKQYHNQALMAVVQLRRKSSQVFDALEDIVIKWAQAKNEVAQKETKTDVETK